MSNGSHNAQTGQPRLSFNMNLAGGTSASQTQSSTSSVGQSPSVEPANSSVAAPSNKLTFNFVGNVTNTGLGTNATNPGSTSQVSTQAPPSTYSTSGEEGYYNISNQNVSNPSTQYQTSATTAPGSTTVNFGGDSSWNNTYRATTSQASETQSAANSMTGTNANTSITTHTTYNSSSSFRPSQSTGVPSANPSYNTSNNAATQASFPTVTPTSVSNQVGQSGTVSLPNDPNVGLRNEPTQQKTSTSAASATSADSVSAITSMPTSVPTVSASSGPVVPTSLFSNSAKLNYAECFPPSVRAGMLRLCRGSSSAQEGDEGDSQSRLYEVILPAITQYNTILKTDSSALRMTDVQCIWEGMTHIQAIRDYPVRIEFSNLLCTIILLSEPRVARDLSLHFARKLALNSNSAELRIANTLVWSAACPHIIGLQKDFVFHATYDAKFNKNSEKENEEASRSDRDPFTDHDLRYMLELVTENMRVGDKKLLMNSTYLLSEFARSPFLLHCFITNRVSCLFIDDAALVPYFETTVEEIGIMRATELRMYKNEVLRVLYDKSLQSKAAKGEKPDKDEKNDKKQGFFDEANIAAANAIPKQTSLQTYLITFIFELLTPSFSSDAYLMYSVLRFLNNVFSTSKLMPDIRSALPQFNAYRPYSRFSTLQSFTVLETTYTIHYPKESVTPTKTEVEKHENSTNSENGDEKSTTSVNDADTIKDTKVEAKTSTKTETQNTDSKATTDSQSSREKSKENSVEADTAATTATTTSTEPTVEFTSASRRVLLLGESLLSCVIGSPHESGLLLALSSPAGEVVILACEILTHLCSCEWAETIISMLITRKAIPLFGSLLTCARDISENKDWQLEQRLSQHALTAVLAAIACTPIGAAAIVEAGLLSKLDQKLIALQSTSGNAGAATAPVVTRVTTVTHVEEVNAGANEAALVTALIFRNANALGEKAIENPGILAQLDGCVMLALYKVCQVTTTIPDEFPPLLCVPGSSHLSRLRSTVSSLIMSFAGLYSLCGRIAMKDGQKRVCAYSKYQNHCLLYGLRHLFQYLSKDNQSVFSFYTHEQLGIPNTSLFSLQTMDLGKSLKKIIRKENEELPDLSPEFPPLSIYALVAVVSLLYSDPYDPWDVYFTTQLDPGTTAARAQILDAIYDNSLFNWTSSLLTLAQQRMGLVKVRMAKVLSWGQTVKQTMKESTERIHKIQTTLDDFKKAPLRGIQLTPEQHTLAKRLRTQRLNLEQEINSLQNRMMYYSALSTRIRAAELEARFALVACAALIASFPERYEMLKPDIHVDKQANLGLLNFRGVMSQQLAQLLSNAYAQAGKMFGMAEMEKYVLNTPPVTYDAVATMYPDQLKKEQQQQQQQYQQQQYQQQQYQQYQQQMMGHPVSASGFGHNSTTPAAGYGTYGHGSTGTSSAMGSMGTMNDSFASTARAGYNMTTNTSYNPNLAYKTNIITHGQSVSHQTGGTPRSDYTRSDYVYYGSSDGVGAPVGGDGTETNEYMASGHPIQQSGIYYNTTGNSVAGSNVPVYGSGVGDGNVPTGDAVARTYTLAFGANSNSASDDVKRTKME